MIKLNKDSNSPKMERASAPGIKVKKYNIKGIVLSNISNFMLISDLYKSNKNLELIANYTFNIYNNETINKLSDRSAEYQTGTS